MSIAIPNEIMEAARMSEAEMLQELALALFQREKLTFGQASRLAGMSHWQFQHLLASRRIAIHYDVAELEADVQTLRDLGRL